MDWEFASEALESGRGQRYVVRRAGAEVPYADFIDALADDETARCALIATLAAVPYRGFKWETPAVTRATRGRAFECVVLAAPGLARRADPVTFAARFVEDAPVVEFPSLGGDAILVAPCPRGPLTAYAHLAAFVREAPGAQQHALLQRVAAALRRRLSESPVWLSTAGGGVAWLHVRLDDRPKYYGHAPYRAVP